MTHDLHSWTFDELRRLLPGAEHASEFRLSYAMSDAGRLHTVGRLVALTDHAAPLAAQCSPPTDQAPTAPAPGDPLAVGIWYQSAVSGMWYRNRGAAGDLAAVRVDGVLFEASDKERGS